VQGATRSDLSVSAYSVIIDSCSFTHASLLTAPAASPFGPFGPFSPTVSPSSSSNSSQLDALLAALSITNATALTLTDSSSVLLRGLTLTGYSTPYLAPGSLASLNRNLIAAASAAVRLSSGLRLLRCSNIVVEASTFTSLLADSGAAVTRCVRVYFVFTVIITCLIFSFLM
jgi:hypothetical protein